MDQQLPKRVKSRNFHRGTAVEYKGKGHYRIVWDETREVIPSRTVAWDDGVPPEPEQEPDGS